MNDWKSILNLRLNNSDEKNFAQYKISRSSSCCIVIQLNFEYEIPSFTCEEECFIWSIVSNTIKHIISEIILELLFVVENIVLLLLNKLRQIPTFYQSAITYPELVYVVILVIIGKDVLAIYHLNLIEENIWHWCLDGNDSHYFKSISSSIELADVNVFTPIAYIKVVVIMSNPPSFTNCRWQRNLCFKLRIQRRIQVFIDY